MHISANESPHLTAAVKQQKMASFHLSTDYLFFVSDLSILSTLTVVCNSVSSVVEI